MPFVLQHEFFLVLHCCFAIAFCAHASLIALQVHLGLCQHVLVTLERTLRLQKIGAILARIDVNQRIAFTYQLPFLKVHGDDHAIHLRSNRIGIYRSHRADRVNVNADVTLLGRHGRDRDLWRRGLLLFRSLVVAPYQHDGQHAVASNNRINVTIHHFLRR